MGRSRLGEAAQALFERHRPRVGGRGGPGVSLPCRKALGLALEPRTPGRQAAALLFQTGVGVPNALGCCGELRLAGGEALFAGLRVIGPPLEILVERSCIDGRLAQRSLEPLDLRGALGPHALAFAPQSSLEVSQPLDLGGQPRDLPLLGGFCCHGAIVGLRRDRGSASGSSRAARRSIAPSPRPMSHPPTTARIIQATTTIASNAIH